MKRFEEEERERKREKRRLKKEEARKAGKAVTKAERARQGERRARRSSHRARSMSRRSRQQMMARNAKRLCMSKKKKKQQQKPKEEPKPEPEPEPKDAAAEPVLDDWDASGSDGDGDDWEASLGGKLDALKKGKAWDDSDEEEETEVVKAYNEPVEATKAPKKSNSSEEAAR